MSNSTTALVDLAGTTNSLFIEAIKANNRRQLAFAKSVLTVATEPYVAKEIPAVVGETIERVEQILELTTNDLQTTGRNTAELAKLIVAQAATVREQSLSDVRTLARNGVTTLKATLVSAEERLDGLAKRLDAPAV